MDGLTIKGNSMPTISPLARRTPQDNAEYQKNFHEGHRKGHSDHMAGLTSQFGAGFDVSKPGFSDGYKAGVRLAGIELRSRRK